VAAFSNSLDPSQREPAPNPRNEKGRPQAATAILKSETYRTAEMSELVTTTGLPALMTLAVWL
jgi:hypothetical protein